MSRHQSDTVGERDRTLRRKSVDVSEPLLLGCRCTEKPERGKQNGHSTFSFPLFCLEFALSIPSQVSVPFDSSNGSRQLVKKQNVSLFSFPLFLPKGTDNRRRTLADN